MIITRFAQSGKPDAEGSYKFFVETVEGERIECEDPLIRELWNNWLITEGSVRADDESWTIFVLAHPLELTETQKKNIISQQ